LIKLKDIEVESLKLRRDKLKQDFTGMKKTWLAEKQVGVISSYRWRSSLFMLR
jgi:hypothetical protein